MQCRFNNFTLKIYIEAINGILDYFNGLEFIVLSSKEGRQVSII